MLTRQRADIRCYTLLPTIVSFFLITRTNRNLLLPTVFLQFQLNVSTLPPIQFRNIRHPAVFKPHLIPQRREEMRVWELLRYALDSRITQVVVVIVTYNHRINDW